ncbi:helix-turn-helix domain-containing protein [Parvularcula sp. IMCC14364]|uniref:MerR family transcriptional regulator n=1 Tax=Parvularcula sp. IMCC14364 TaxID=3067902 RepID=UPI0027422F11|nr:helix-turn-helix domain-containing protein [Parvularcula sp. IMCC14364]
MQIGALSEQSGVNIETIRYYEKTGLVPQPPRSGGGRREFDEIHLKRLVFVRRARELGFSIDEVKQLIALQETPPACKDVYTLTEHHLADIRKKIRDLKQMERTLTGLANKCERGATPDCPIIEALNR